MEAAEPGKAATNGAVLGVLALERGTRGELLGEQKGGVACQELQPC